MTKSLSRTSIALAYALFFAQTTLTSALSVEYYDYTATTIGSTRMKDKGITPFKTEDPMKSDKTNFYSGGDNVATSEKPDFVGAWFYGSVHFDEVGIYTICTNSDDGSKVWIDNVLVVDNDELHVPEVKCGDYSVSTPSVKFVEVDYFEHEGGSSTLALLWKKPSSSSDPVPTPFLSAAAVDALTASDAPSLVPSSEPSISNAPTEYVSTTH